MWDHWKSSGWDLALSLPYCCFYSVAKSCPTLCDPMNCSTPGFPVLLYCQEFAQTHIHWIGDAIQQLHPLSPPLPLFLTALVWVQSLVGELRSLKPSGLTEKKKEKKTPQNCCFKPLFWDNCYKAIGMHPMVVLVLKNLPANAADMRRG